MTPWQREQNGQNWQQIWWSIPRDIYGKHPAICETTTGTAGLVGSLPGICDINVIGIPPDTSEDRAIHHRAMKTTLPKFHMGPENGTLEWKIPFWNPSFLGSMLNLRSVMNHAPNTYTTETESKKILKISHPKRKRSSSNHPFSGAFFWFQGG